MTRSAARSRTTKETSIEISLDVDGDGAAVEVSTGLPFFDHMLSQIGKHGAFDLTVKATGDLEVDGHHTVEDVGIALGEVFAEALGDKAGVRRFASGLYPLDEAIAEFREAVRLDPRFSAAYLFLGRALVEAGDYQAALDALARVDVGPPAPDPILTASSLVARAERMIGLGARLPAVVEGCDRPADPEEIAAFARLAFSRRQYAAASRLWAEAFAASPAIAADLASSNRQQAARAAAAFRPRGPRCARPAASGGAGAPRRR